MEFADTQRASQPVRCELQSVSYRIGCLNFCQLSAPCGVVSPGACQTTAGRRYRRKAAPGVVVRAHMAGKKLSSASAASEASAYQHSAGERARSLSPINC